MTHVVSKEVAEALDCVIEKYGIEGALNIHGSDGRWAVGKFYALNGITNFQMASYLLEGYKAEIPSFIEPLEKHLLNASLGEIIGDIYTSSKFKEDSVLADLWNKAELSISDVAGHLRRKYGLDVQ